MVKNMLWLSIFLVILIIVCLMGIYYAINFNKLNDLKTKIHEAEVIIDEALRMKYDTLMRVSNHIRKHMDSNKNYFKEYEKLNNILDGLMISSSLNHRSTLYIMYDPQPNAFAT